MSTSALQAQAAKYADEGYLSPLRAMEAAAAAGYVARLEAAEAEFGDRVLSEWRHKPHLVMNWANDLIRLPSILDSVEAIIGPDILCWESVLFVKPANSADYISWHQDLTYWGLGADEVLTAWLALSPSTRESGCMQVIAGTHTRDVVPHIDKFGATNMLSRGQEIAVEIDLDQAVNFELRPGEFSLHHVKIFHGSERNRSDQRRIGFAIRYLPPHVHQAYGDSDSATLVRGSPDGGNYQLEDRPERDFDPAAIAYHATLRDRRYAVLMRDT